MTAINRREMLKWAGLSSLALAVNPWDALGQSLGSMQLTVLHTNDVHSHIDPQKADGRKYGGLGGASKRAALIEQIRQEGQDVLLLDAGDLVQGTPYFNFFDGKVEYELMNAMGYDAMTLGNHDFDNGVEGLLRMLDRAKFSCINSNYDLRGSAALKSRVKKYQVFRKAGRKIGVFGLGIDLNGLVADRHFSGVVYQDPIAIAKEMVQELRKNQGCDMVICLSHLGFEYPNEKVSDLVLASGLDGIDLIIGGHTHTFLEKPLVVPSVVDLGHETVVNQVGWAGIYLGRLDYQFSAKSSSKLLTSRAIPIGLENNFQG